jgi:hypothetical protein
MGDAGGLAFGKKRGGKAVAGRSPWASGTNSPRTSSGRLPEARDSGFDGATGSSERHSQERAGATPVSDRAAGRTSERPEASWRAAELEAVLAVVQQPHSAEGVPAQQAFTGWAVTLVWQAETSPATESIPMTAAKAIQGNRRWW